MAESNGDKQEKPTAKRLKDAKEKGQVARSRELGAAFGLVAAALSLAWLGTDLARAMAARLAQDLGSLDVHASAAITTAEVSGVVWHNVAWLGTALGPLTGAVATVVIAGFAVQGGVRFAPQALALHWDHLAPAHGAQRFKLSKSGADVARAFLALALVAIVTVPVVRDVLHRAPDLVMLTPIEAASEGWQQIWRLLWRGALALIALGAADYLWQRYSWMRGLRMSRQDVRDEMRQQEGNPEMKARVRRVQREMARSRMLSNVKTSTVVVTNPTHFAVALTYDRTRMAAPIVVASGADAMAAKIRAVARKAGVPIIENPPLARALYAAADIGDAVPASLFTAVAEVLAYLVRIRQLVL
jgi:flagellar biosynthetic protein FlhB